MKGIRLSPNCPYVFTIEPRVCGCQQEPTVFKTGKTLEAVEVAAQAYWNVWLGFFGDQLQWLVFTIVDTRDGAVWWRNDRRTKGAESGEGKLPIG